MSFSAVGWCSCCFLAQVQTEPQPGWLVSGLGPSVWTVEVGLSWGVVENLTRKDFFLVVVPRVAGLAALVVPPGCCLRCDRPLGEPAASSSCGRPCGGPAICGCGRASSALVVAVLITTFLFVPALRGDVAGSPSCLSAKSWARYHQVVICCSQHASGQYLPFRCTLSSWNTLLSRSMNLYILLMNSWRFSSSSSLSGS